MTLNAASTLYICPQSCKLLTFPYRGGCLPTHTGQSSRRKCQSPLATLSTPLRPCKNSVLTPFDSTLQGLGENSETTSVRLLIFTFFDNILILMIRLVARASRKTSERDPVTAWQFLPPNYLEDNPDAYGESAASFSRRNICG